MIDDKHKPTTEPEEEKARREEGSVEENELDEALDETFPASDPIAPSRIDGPSDGPSKKER
ncbi:hypothetical protein [Jiella marina]|uniref:hypothetical protein n=1 Tax=Jiella sp. LLJ827 TaxID=2917712 RepID=UPI0021011046|nr:hypothetical protein [Jiella sp. LLJ827]MCQ0989425.1 hypothetical protein [Jiella sp. LLJ827]